MLIHLITMHKAILSQRERTLLTKFLKNETITDETFRMLKMRIKRNYSCINEDFELIKQVKEKIC